MTAQAQKACSSSRLSRRCFSVCGVVGPHVLRVRVGADQTDKCLPGSAELLTWFTVAGCHEERLGFLTPLVGGPDEDGQYG